MLVVVQKQPFAHFACSEAHNGFRIGVVSRRPIKYLNAKRAFLQAIRFAGQSIFDDVLQQRWIALAVAEVRAGNYLV